MKGNNCVPASIDFEQPMVVSINIHYSWNIPKAFSSQDIKRGYYRLIFQTRVLVTKKGSNGVSPSIDFEQSMMVST